MPEETVLLLVTPKRNDARIDRDLNLNNWLFFSLLRNRNQETQWWIVISWPGHGRPRIYMRQEREDCPSQSSILWTKCEKKTFSSESARNQSFYFLGPYSGRIIDTESQWVSNLMKANFVSKQESRYVYFSGTIWRESRWLFIFTKPNKGNPSQNNLCT